MRVQKPKLKMHLESFNMTEFSYQLLIKPVCGEETQEQRLYCKALLRNIHGVRQVYDAVWNNKAVIVKVFRHRIKAGLHLKKEWRGLNELRKRGLNSPEPLFCGKTSDGYWALVEEKVSDSLPAIDIFLGMKSPEAKLNILLLVCREMAAQHQKGVLQKDFHLGNFLLKNDKVFTIDPGQVKFYSGELSRKESISHLAWLVMGLPAENPHSVSKLSEEYAQCRGWHFDKEDILLLERKAAAHTKTAIRKQLKKCMRTGKRKVRIKTGRCLAVFAADFLMDADGIDFINQIDKLMDAGSILKDGNTCYVSRLMWNGKDIVVKRFNHKNLIHSFRHTIRHSRARRCWLNAHRLGMLGAATPRPLAFIEEYKGPLIWKSYFVTEFVEAPKLYDFLRDESIGSQQKSKALSDVIELINRLSKYRISHGDLKHTNILITRHGPVLIDLDAMTVHKLKWLFKINHNKDLAFLQTELKL